MIETFQTLHEIYDKLTSLQFNFSYAYLTLGNSFKKDKKQVHHNTKKYFFGNIHICME